MWLLFFISSAYGAISQPSQIRTAWTENPNELSVRWSTFALSPLSKIAYRPVNCNSTEGWLYEPSMSEMFREGDLYFQIQFIHTVVIKDLDPLCDYEYQVGTFFYWSDIRTISGFTPGNDLGKPISLAILGDMGVGSNSTDSRKLLIQMTENREIDGVIHLGDIGYDLGDDGGYTGDQFLRDIEPVASRVAYMTMPGNHEHYSNFVQYIRRFRMPDVTQAPDTNFFYSFDLGKAHFIVLNSEAHFYLDTTARSIQHRWLREDLEKAALNREAVPWIFAFAHKPLYCNMDWTLPYDNPHTNTNCGEQAMILRGAWETLFNSFNVDIYFSGHVHNYQRMAPIFRNLTVPSYYDSKELFVNPNAPIYILSGDSGSDHGHEPLSPTPQLWSIHGTDAYGFGKLTVFNQTHVRWVQYNSEKIEVEDVMWVIKTE